MSESHLNLNWSPPGPVSAAFMRSVAPVEIINGPIGSGKTTTALVKTLRIAERQAPSRHHTAINSRGVRVPLRRFKLAIVRDTYRQLWRTTIPSWFRRVPQDVGTFEGAKNAPARHHIQFEIRDGTIVDYIVEFGAIQDTDVEEFMRGYEPTMFYLNELDILSQEVLAFAQDRAGRYPEMDDGGPTWRGVLADCNAPEFESWLFELVFTKSKEELAALGVELFVQPGGRDPGAENLINLPSGYYTPKIGQADWYDARMLQNKPGYSRGGKPVYPEYSDRLHCAGQDLEPLSGLPLLVGLDAGGSPASAIAQHLPTGQWRVIDELVSEQGTGAKRFARNLAQLLRERYPGFVIQAWADPSAAYGADREDDEADWMQIVGATMGITVAGAPTNLPTARWEAVRAPLQRLVDGTPGLVLSPRCKVLRTGFNNGYRYRKLNVPGAVRYAEAAEKNQYSHVHDALQYVLSAGGEDHAIRERKVMSARDAAEAARRRPRDWDPHADAYGELKSPSAGREWDPFRDE